MRRTPLLNLIAIGPILSACAGDHTIGRETALPNGPTSNQALALHLNAQQRIVMVGKNAFYCAEASPEAIAAYVAALAASADPPAIDTNSPPAGSSRDIASIGLRTQSITLMRDALYRLCEEAANGMISPRDVALLQRSQDLTAVTAASDLLNGTVDSGSAMSGAMEPAR